MDVKRGDVFFVTFDPSIGGEIKKKRPAVIVSTDKANPFLNRVAVVPLSSQVSKIYPSETKILVLGQEHKAMADQIRTVAKQRLISKMTEISPADMRKIEEKMQLYLEIL